MQQYPFHLVNVFAESHFDGNISQNHYPISKAIHQGDDMGRPNRLTLNVDNEQNIFVSGNVIEVGKGEFYL